MNPRTFLINGLIAGFLAGIFAFGVAHQVGEPYVDQSIAVESTTLAHSHGEEDTVVSREKQSTLGLLTATLAIGTALGGIAGIASAFALGRLGSLRPAASTAVVSLVGFVSLALAAWAKYPPNPPAVGKAATLDSRTADYFTFLALSAILALGAVVLAARLARKYGGWIATIVPALGWLILITVIGLILPAVNEVPDTFAANTLWGFRLGSIATQATLWGAIGIILSGLVARNWNAAENRRKLAASIR